MMAQPSGISRCHKQDLFVDRIQRAFDTLDTRKLTVLRE